MSIERNKTIVQPLSVKPGKRLNTEKHFGNNFLFCKRTEFSAVLTVRPIVAHQKIAVFRNRIRAKIIVNQSVLPNNPLITVLLQYKPYYLKFQWSLRQAITRFT